MSKILEPLKHISFSSSQDIAAICSPLKEIFGIDFFMYQRNFLDQKTRIIKSSSLLCNRADVLEFIWFYPKIEREPAKYNFASLSQYFIIDTTQPQFAALLRENCHLYNILCKDEKISDTEWDHFIFGTFAPSSGIINTYLNNTHLLNKFILFFKQQAHQLLDLAYNNKLSSGRMIDTLDEPRLDVNPFSLPESNHSFLSCRNGKQIKVPAAEVKCLKLLYHGRTAKESAKILNLSPRTVETLWNRSKGRFECMTRGDLLDILEKNSDIID